MNNAENSNGEKYTGTYLKTLQLQLSAIFNHAVRYYDLDSNPVKKAGPIGARKSREIKFWTRDAYGQFIEYMKANEQYYYAMEILYWCGIRVGELLALKESDFDFENHTISITKSFQIVNGLEVFTNPKTNSGVRKVTVPVSL